MNYRDVTGNVFLFISVGKPIMYEKTFMYNVARQNFTAYKVKTEYDAPVLVSALVNVNSFQYYSQTMQRTVINLLNISN